MGRSAETRADRGHREPELAEIREGLGDEAVHPAFEQGLGLLAEGGDRLGLADRSERQEVLAERPDGAEHQHVAPHGLANVAREPHPRPVDLAHPALEPVDGELEAVGAERVGLQEVGAGGDVLLVNPLDGLRVVEVQHVEAGVEGHPPGVEHRAHGPVGEERPALEPRDERAGAGSRYATSGRRRE